MVIGHCLANLTNAQLLQEGRVEVVVAAGGNHKHVGGDLHTLSVVSGLHHCSPGTPHM